MHDLTVRGPLVEATVLDKLSHVHVPLPIVALVDSAAPAHHWAARIRRVQASTGSSRQKVERRAFRATPGWIARAAAVILALAVVRAVRQAMAGACIAMRLRYRNQEQSCLQKRHRLSVRCLVDIDTACRY